MATKKTGGTQAHSKTRVTAKSRAKGSKKPLKVPKRESSLSAKMGKTPGSKSLKSGPKILGRTPLRTKSKGRLKPKPRSTPTPVKKEAAQRGVVEDSRYDAIRKLLEGQKAHMLAEAEGIVVDQLNAEETLPDLSDRASAETDQNFTLRLREREQNLVKKIDEAIERIDMGVFGICEVCGGRIAIKRLKVRPMTTLCIECKTAQEKTERARQ